MIMANKQLKEIDLDKKLIEQAIDFSPSQRGSIAFIYAEARNESNLKKNN